MTIRHEILHPKPVILTGDRPTGPLHLGHYVGSLSNRIAMQESHDQYILVADMQALTDNAEAPEKVSQNVLEIATDYLAIGLDPQKSKFVIQSQIPEIALLFMIFSNLVTVARVSRNPTVKEELHQKGLEKNMPLGFFSYPISQAADITIFKATVVPVGEDQIPMIEQTNEIVRRFNHLYGHDVLVEATAVVPKVGRLPGIDGKTKMSKSLKNDITLKATREEVEYAVKMMFTDPNHLQVSSPGQVEGNVVFSYLDAFDPDKEEVAILKAQYQKGGLGDSQIKKRLNAILQDFLAPIRERRRYFEAHPEEVIHALEYGTYQAQKVASSTIQDVKHAMGLDHYQKKQTCRTENPVAL